MTQRLSASVIAALAVALLTAAPAVRAEDLKVGVVNSDRILRDSQPARAAMQKLEAEFSKRDKDMQEMGARLKANAERFEKDGPIMAPGSWPRSRSRALNCRSSRLSMRCFSMVCRILATPGRCYVPRPRPGCATSRLRRAQPYSGRPRCCAPRWARISRCRSTKTLRRTVWREPSPVSVSRPTRTETRPCSWLLGATDPRSGSSDRKDVGSAQGQQRSCSGGCAFRSPVRSNRSTSLPLPRSAYSSRCAGEAFDPRFNGRTGKRRPASLVRAPSTSGGQA